MCPDKLKDERLSEEMIDAILADSFPASDPPSWTLGRDHGERPAAADKEQGPGESQQARLKERLRAPAFLFDLDGTLVDSVYQHVLSWHEALEASGFELAVWRIHRRIGMSGVRDRHEEGHGNPYRSKNDVKPQRDRHLGASR